MTCARKNPYFFEQKDEAGGACQKYYKFLKFIIIWFLVVYKHVIGLKTDSSQSNLGGNTDSNHLISGGVGHFPSVSLRRRPIQLVILISFFFSPASDAGFLPPLWRGRVLPFTVQSRDHLATITDIYVPSFSYVHSPALNAGFHFVHCAVWCHPAV